MHPARKLNSQGVSQIILKNLYDLPKIRSNAQVFLCRTGEYPKPCWVSDSSYSFELIELITECIELDNFSTMLLMSFLEAINGGASKT